VRPRRRPIAAMSASIGRGQGKNMQDAASLDRTALLHEAASNSWFHTIDFGGGEQSVGNKTSSLISAEADAVFGPINLAGRTVLDVGTWDGFFSFEAKRRGALRVLATDHYIWTVHQYARRNFEIARQLTGLDVDDRVIDVPSLSVEEVGHFDYVLFLGVFYHLLDPIRALEAISRIATKGVIVETHLALNFLPWPAMRFYPSNELARDGSNWWGPNRACVTGLLRQSGFDKVDFRPHPKRRFSRGIFHAYKTSAC
jgi:tRNA (mo5U34)-methyltransferase